MIPKVAVAVLLAFVGVGSAVRGRGLLGFLRLGLVSDSWFQLREVRRPSVRGRG